MKKRRVYSAELKARVVLEALSGAYTLAELAKKYDVHPNMITKWKKRAQEHLQSFSPRKAIAWMPPMRRS